MDDTVHGISRLLLDRYVLGECTAEEAAGIEAKMAADTGLKDTVTRLRLDADAFTERNPSFAALDDRVAGRDAVRVQPARRFRTPVWAGALAAAAVVAVVSLVNFRQPAPVTDVLTAKGGAMMELKLKRGASVLSYDADDVLCRPLDTLQFVLHAVKPGFYAVLEETRDGVLKPVLPPKGPSLAGGAPAGDVLEHSLVPGTDDVPRKLYTVVGTDPFSMAAAQQAVRASAEQRKQDFIVQEFGFTAPADAAVQGDE